MGDDIIVFNPEKPMLYSQVVSSLFSFHLITVITSIIAIYFSRNIPVLPIGIGLIAILSILFSFFFGRYPTQVLINKKTRVLKAFYWDSFGNMKSVLIDLERAVITYKPRNFYTTNDRVVAVYDNIFNNWIKIDKRNNFSKEQLDTMFELLARLKNE